jgi:hypothetical protein
MCKFKDVVQTYASVQGVLGSKKPVLGARCLALRIYS